MRALGLWELSFGAAAYVAGALAVGKAHALGEPSPPPAALTANAEPPMAAEPSQTLRETEPPQVVGPEFDDDRALPVTSKRVASYTLSARLDADKREIDAHGSIAWENASSRPVTELWFHLYLNAFKNSRTVFLRSPFTAGRSGHGARHFGYVDVEKLSVREMGDANLWPPRGTLAIDAPDDETDVRVALPRPVAPGERVTLDVAFHDVLPEIVERTGYQRDFFMVGQWFPKLARLLPDGTWVHFPFHAQSEFYADFGSYDVTLDVPDRQVLGATGVLAEEHVQGGRRTARYRIDDVHDFAWTAWEHFRETSDTVDGVRVRVLYPPGNDANAAANLRAVRHGLSYFGRAFGRYPYPVLTVVHPPEFAPAASGMEYPTLITTGFPWYTSALSTFVERVALHELGHQWFYGLVATDEHAFPFLDEGLTTYAESLSTRALLGPGNGFHAPGLDVDGAAYLRSLAVSAGHDGIVARPAADFPSFRDVGALVYARTSILLETLARVYGQERVVRAIGRYARRYRFEHPGPKHLVAVVREVVGDDAADFLATGLFDGGTVDFVARDLASVRDRPAAGVFDGPSGRTTAASVDDPPGPAHYLGRVVVYRHGTLRVPVDVEFRLSDGTRIRKSWDGRGAFSALECEGGSPIVAAIVDPDEKVLVDDDLANNGIRTSPGSTARLVERSLYASELALSAFGP